MTRPGRLLRALVADPRALRAVDETMLDIRAEHDAARSPWARLSWFARSVMALVRVSVRVLPLDLSAMALGGWTLRVAAWATLLLAPIIASPWMRLAHGTRSLGLGTQVLLLATLVPQGLALVLPVALFLVAIWPPRRSLSPPALQAVMAAAIVFLFILTVPVASQVFRSVAYAAISGTTRSLNVPERGVREMSLGALVQEAFVGRAEDRNSRHAREQLVARTGLIAVAAALALLGAFLRRAKTSSERTAPRLWLYALGMPALAYAPSLLVGPWGLWLSALAVLALATRLALTAASLVPNEMAVPPSR